MLSLNPTISSSYLLNIYTQFQGETALREYLCNADSTSSPTIHSFIYLQPAKTALTKKFNNFYGAKENGFLLVSLLCSPSPKSTWLTTAHLRNLFSLPPSSHSLLISSGIDHACLRTLFTVLGCAYSSPVAILHLFYNL